MLKNFLFDEERTSFINLSFIKLFNKSLFVKLILKIYKMLNFLLNNYRKEIDTNYNFILLYKRNNEIVV